MGNIPLLTRNEEVELAKDIQSGKQEIIDLLMRNPVFIQYLQLSFNKLHKEIYIKDFFDFDTELDIENDNKINKVDDQETLQDLSQFQIGLTSLSKAQEIFF